jgi:hypothetical protein
MKNIWKNFVILTAFVVLWNHIIVSPFKELSSIFHKFGHALSSAVFEYGVEAFSTTFENNGDVVFTAHSWMTSFIIANSGYISSILFSILILFLKKTAVKKYMVGGITILYLIFSIIFTPSVSALAISMSFGVIAIVLLMIGKDSLNELMLDIISMSLAAYVIFDTFVDTILLILNGQLSIMKNWSQQPPADIVKLSELTGFPAVVWGLIWLAIAVISVNMLLLKTGVKKK